MCVLKVDTSPVSLARKAAARQACKIENDNNQATKMTIEQERKYKMNTSDFNKNNTVDMVPLGVFWGEDVVEKGTFRGGDKIPNGTFRW